MELLEQDLIATAFDLNLDEPGGLSAVAGLDLETLYAQPQRLSHWQLAHYAAVESWLLDYRPRADATGLEQVRGYLEAIHHLVELEDWPRAEQLFMTPIQFEEERQSVCDRLYSKGYFNELKEIGLKLLEHMSTNYQLLLHLKIGDCLRKFGDFKTADNHYNHILNNELIRSQKYADLYGDTLSGLGHCKNQGADYKQARKLFLRRLELATASENLDQITKAELDLACLMGDWGHFKESLSWIKRSYDHSLQLSNLRLKTEILGLLGSSYMRLGKTELAEKYLLEQLAIARQSKIIHQEWVAISNLGGNLVNSDNFQAGLRYLETALLISKSRNDLLGEYINRGNIASVYARSGQYKKAIILFQDLLQLSIKLGDIISQASDLNNLSYCYARLRHPDQKMVFSNLRQSIHIFRSINHRPMESFATAGLANAYWCYGHHIKGILTILMAFWIQPPWASADGRFMLKKTLETIFAFLYKSRT